MLINSYTDEINVQIVVVLLKEHGIKRIVISPGATNVNFVASVQKDTFFEVYSSIDERSAAYIACGLAAETGDPVVLSCTGATASRNYIPGLTEAYYRKLPVLAVTSTLPTSKTGHLTPQQMDRSVIQNDIAKISVALPIVKDDEDRWDCEMKVNKAILELKRDGGGPAHINLPTTYSKSYNVKKMPKFRVINRFTAFDKLPDLPKGRIAIFIGSHKSMSKNLSDSIDKFCQTNDAVVFCDHTSSYKGKYRVLYSIAAIQAVKLSSIVNPELLIHIGEISGDYYTTSIEPKQVWRLSEDGEIRDKFRLLNCVFEMSEEYFFGYYSKSISETKNTYLTECANHLAELYGRLPELPFSNLWIASVTADHIPPNSSIHFGILNSLRSWNFFELPNSVSSFSNVGGFGIDGCVSSLIGASLANTEKLYFGVVGDLAFFYDLNSLGNRHIVNNIRILLVNNGKGIEFKNFNHHAALFEKDADDYMAAAGHFGNKSMCLVKHYAEDLGFEYLSASSKEEFKNVCNRFLTSKITDKPMILEVFTNESDESMALKMMFSMDHSTVGSTKEIAKTILGAKGVNMLKKVLGK